MNFFANQIIEHDNVYVIKNFPYARFAAKLQRYYGTSKLSNVVEYIGIGVMGALTLSGANRATIRVHKFFVPELVYLLQKFQFELELVTAIITGTWLNETMQPVTDKLLDQSEITKRMSVKLHPYQQTFVDMYEENKIRNQLNGYILSFEQGLGKTPTALALMCALKKKLVIVIAPKSTLRTVWEYHINTFFKAKQKICINGVNEITSHCDFLLVNYEGLDKLGTLIPELSKHANNLGIIVDESHNFLRTASNRTQQLIQLRQVTKCTDILLMSGTPIKALGVEIVPMLMVLDRYMDEEALTIFKKAFGWNVAVATDVLRERLSRMMYRKTKDEVLQLPEKSEETLYIKIPNAEQYTVTHVKSAAMQFVTDRRVYHLEQMPKYKVSFDAALAYAEQHVANKSQFAVYKDHTNYMRKHDVSTRNPHDAEIIKWCNAYEKTTLIPILPDKLRREFVAVKAAVKYLHLKIQGEVIGQFLMRLRIKMTSDLVAHSGLTEIIENATKKTVIFTSYVDTIEVTSAYLKKHGYTPVLVYGETAGELVAAVEQFTKNPKVNPLIASIQMLATGVTLVTANTMIFLNVPWRWTDKDQAEARIHRLGQDTPVMIYTIILDTGAEANLSSRMDEIISWSKDMFDQLVGSV